MFSAILILLLLPITDVSRSRGMQFRPLSKIAFYVFVANFLILMQLGAKHVESPFIEFGQISTVLYFLYFTVIMYSVTFIENSLVELELPSDAPSVNPKSDYQILSDWIDYSISKNSGLNLIHFYKHTLTRKYEISVGPYSPKGGNGLRFYQV